MSMQFLLSRNAWLVIVAALCFASSHADAATGARHHAKVIAKAVPTAMVGTNAYVITVEMKNAGDQPWTVDSGFHLSWREAGASVQWGDVNAPLGENTSIAPGQTATFTFQVTAPQTPGRYNLAWQMVDDKGNQFGEVVRAANVIVENATNRATSNMQLIPDQVDAGARFTAVVQFENAGKTTWNRDAGYYLASVDSRAWNVTRVDLPGDGYVTPGETATFRVELTAPRQPGEYRLQWQMRQGADGFGRASNPVYVNVGATAPRLPALNAEFVYQDVPQQMRADQNYTVSLQFKNTGETAWTPQHEQLVAINPANNLNWMIDRVDLVSMTRQGEFYTFRFTVRAPTQPGDYDFQWRMLRDGNSGFGTPSENLVINVVQGL